MTTENYNKHLNPPDRQIDAILDTDTYNEIDDQFALAYMVRSKERINVKAVYAAPFFNPNAESVADGMEKSYNEIHNILTLMDEEELKSSVFRGSDRYLENETTPVISDAARDLAERAMSYTEENPLYVVAIGAITNIASALLINPEIKERIVIVWLGGHSHHWPNTREFNMCQDVAAARVIFNSQAPLVQFPCMGVVSAFTISGADMRAHLHGKNKLCNYLVEHTEEEISRYIKDDTAWSRIIWDVTAVAWLNCMNGGKLSMLAYTTKSAPIPEYNDKYSFDDERHKMAYIFYIRRDELFNDLINKLTK